jgi:hypothetical protein
LSYQQDFGSYQQDFQQAIAKKKAMRYNEKAMSSQTTPAKNIPF